MSAAKEKKLVNDLVQRFVEERQRMAATHDKLVEGSEILDRTAEEYHRYSSVADRAGAALKRLHKQMEEDYRYLWGAFLFLMGVCAYIFLKRSGILWLTMTAASLGFKSSNFFVRNTFQFIFYIASHFVTEESKVDILTYAVDNTTTLSTNDIYLSGRDEL